MIYLFCLNEFFGSILKESRSLSVQTFLIRFSDVFIHAMTSIEGGL